MQTASTQILLLVAAMGIVATGCGGPPTRDASVAGTVLVDGQLAERGTVSFHPVDGGPLAVGRIMPDGSYTVRTGQGDLSDVDRGTLKSGEYKVTIVVYGESGEPLVEGGPPPAGPRLTAAKYASVTTTDLKRTVKAGDNLFVFELEGAATAESAADENIAEGNGADASVDEVTRDDDSNSEQDSEPTSESAGTSEGIGESAESIEEVQP